MHVKAVQ